MITLSYNQAIKIQRAQLEWYRPFIGRAGVKAIQRTTRPCPADIHPDTPINICTVNKLVPRGGSIERFLKRRPPLVRDSDELRIAVHRAMINGHI